MDLLVSGDVLLEHFGAHPDFAGSAHKVMAMGLFGDVTLWTTSVSLAETAVRLREVADPKEVQEAIAKCLEFLKVCPVGADDMAGAIDAKWPTISDGILATCADKLKANYIVARTISGLEASRVKVVTPTEMVDIMQDEKGFNYDYKER